MILTDGSPIEPGGCLDVVKQKGLAPPLSETFKNVLEGKSLSPSDFEVRVYDMQGALAASHFIAAGSVFNFNSSFLAAGLYLFSLEHQGESITMRKFID
jgi:hypothetical protein